MRTPILGPTKPAAPSKSLAADMRQAHKKALAELAVWFSARCAEEIKAPKWAYNTNPKIRDIVASGDLLRSARIIKLPRGGFEVIWEVPYATEVHEGGVSPKGIPFAARPWTKEPLAELPAKYDELLKKHLGATLK